MLMHKKNPKLIVFCGLQASGKSALAEALSKGTGLAVISVDPIESAIIKGGIEKSFETGYAAYLVAKEIAEEQLKLGNSIIIDAANYVRQAQQIWEELAKEHKCKLRVIECFCSDELEHKKRINNRVRNLAGLNEVKWEDVQERKKETEVWDIAKLTIDTRDSLGNINQNLEGIKDYIS